MKWDNGRIAAARPRRGQFHRAAAQVEHPQAVYALTADLYERNEYGDFDDSKDIAGGR